ncbi:tyrosine-protein phosphatase [Labedella endophytica]|nr:tyrosine-protein phosphatase [Labedella endophytica]
MRALQVDGTFNARAFGALRSPWLVRSGSLDRLSTDGEAALRDLGVTLVVDLREDGERPEVAHGLEVRSIPLYRATDGVPLTGTLEGVYELLLRTRGAELAAAVAVIAGAEGAILVHCTAGKDRTGLVVALALLAGGAPRDMVLSDYAASGPSVAPARMEAVTALLAELTLDDAQRADALRLHLDSPREALEHALAVLDELGGPRRFLSEHGLTDGQFRVLADRVAALA